MPPERRRRSVACAAAVLGIAAALVPAFASSVIGHTPLAAGNYVLEVGWLHEPALVGEPNAIQLTITTKDETPVTDLVPGDLSVVVTVAGHDSPSLAFAPPTGTADPGEPGEYRAAFTPTVAGGYQFEVSGSIHGTPVDVLDEHAQVQEPYRFLHPTAGQPGSPTSFSSTLALDRGVSPVIVATTGETPPQAQLITQRGAILLNPDTTSLQVSIVAVETAAEPADGHIAGNVYRVLVTDQAGKPLSIKPCDGCISLVLLAPEDLGQASIRQYADGAWTDLETTHAGVVATYQANVKALGDFAIIEVTEATAGPSPVLLIGGIAVVVIVVSGTLLLVGVRQARVAPNSNRKVRR